MSASRQQILEMIDAYTNAELAVLKGKSYSIAGRTLTRADLQQIIEGRESWEQRLVQYDMNQRGGSPLYAVSEF